MNSTESTKNGSILIVDDNPINVSLLQRALQDDYAVRTAYDGEAALSRVREELPDLILLDVMMPGMSGFEVMAALKADRATDGIPVIFVTALDQGASEAEGLGLGAVDYIHKPFDIALVKLRVRNQIQLKQQQILLQAQKTELEETLARIKRLEGIISICMYCKQIRNDQQSWQRIEEYISEHSEAMFSHGICPSCMEVHFPELDCTKKKAEPGKV